MPRISLAALAAVFALAAPALADDATTPAVPDLVSSRTFDRSGWTRLGSTILSGQKTTAVVPLADTKGNLDQLTFVVDGELQLAKITVVTDGGKRLVRTVKHYFFPGASSKQVDLTGNKRTLRSVTLAYKLPAAAIATVIVYGRDSTRAAAPTAVVKREEVTTGTITLTADTTTRRVISAREGWTLLGAQTVDVGRASDVVRVPAATFGMFTQLAIVVSDGELELSGMRLRLDGGQVADISTQHYFRGDDRIRIVNLPSGDAKALRSVLLRYGAERGSGTTRIELWAR